MLLFAFGLSLHEGKPQRSSGCYRSPHKSDVSVGGLGEECSQGQTRLGGTAQASTGHHGRWGYIMKCGEDTSASGWVVDAYRGQPVWFCWDLTNPRKSRRAPPGSSEE